MQISKLFLLISLVTLSAFNQNRCLAQENILVKIPNSNDVAIATVPANTASNTPVVFYYLSKGNLTSKLGVEIYGPKGIETKVEAAQVISSVTNTLSKGSFWRIPLDGSIIELSNKSSPRSYYSRVTNTTPKVARSIISDCASIPPSILVLLLKNLSEQEGRVISHEEACGEASPGLPPSDTGLITPTPTPIGSSSPTTPQVKIESTYGSSNAILQKDSCSTNKNYLVKITLSLSKVSAEALNQGFNIQGRLRELEYTGGRAASLKPKSDGKYAPRPLLLMQSIGGEQKVNLVKWTKGQPLTLTTVAATNSLAFYRGYVLIRIIADKLISGGRGEKVNFELTNGTSIYNVCGKRARVRWKVNGYPGGS